MASVLGLNLIQSLHSSLCLILLLPIACRAVGGVFQNSSTLVPTADASQMPLSMRVGLGTVILPTADASQHLLSNNGLFAFLFQDWQDSGMSYCMAGVAYTKKLPGIMWSFNYQDTQPMRGSSCMLNLSSHGVLSLQNGSGIVWKTNTSDVGVHSLVLHDDGNLVLESIDGEPLWQSFNETIYVMLPGAKHFTKRDTLYQREQVRPTSQFSVPGRLGMRLSQVRGVPHLLFFLRESMFVYYSLSPATTQNQSLAEEAEYYVVIGDSIEFHDSNASLIGSIAGNLNITPDPGSLKSAYIFRDNEGRLQINFLRVVDHKNVQYYDMPLNECSNPFDCNAGEYQMCDTATGRCSCPPGFEENSINCRAVDGSKNMVPIPVSFHPQLSLASSQKAAGSQDGCKGLCEDASDCNAALYDSNTRSCSLFPVLFTVKAGDSTTGQVMMLKIPSSLNTPQRKSLAHIIGAVVGVLLFFCLLCIGLAFLRSQRRRHNNSAHDELFLHELPRLPPRFSYREMQLATKDFSTELGVGGFGSVYEGVLASNGTKVAVKRLDRGGAAQSMDQFRAEVATIGSISHMNLVRLKGFCMEGVSRLLVYEFMARGSLDRWLFEKKGEEEGFAADSTFLNWETRRQIALDMARGLEYLHHQCGEKIVHCDVKPENILLDEKFNAKVADFGLAKLIGADDHSFVMTTLKGTRGYLAPEWLQHTTITTKSDVYSYGVVLLELISGQRCLDAEHGYLPTWALSIACGTSTESVACIDTNRVEAELLDERLRGQNVPMDELERVLLIGLACVNSDPVHRPTMASVVQMLDGLIDALPVAGLQTSQVASPGPGYSEAYALLHSDVMIGSLPSSSSNPQAFMYQVQAR